jgi:dihydroflavonol-4-reductase
VDGTRAALAAAADVGVRRVVVTSSSVTCGSSPGPEAVDESHALGAEFAPAYFRVKQAQEDLALELGAQLGLEIVIACPTVVLGGPATRLVPSNAILARYLLDPSRTTFAGGSNVVSAGDVGVGHALLAESGVPGWRYLLGGRNLTWRELHELIGELAGVPGPFLTADTEAAVLAARAAGWWGRLTSRAPLVTADEARTVGRYYWYRHDRAAGLGYAPGSPRAAVAEALAWLLASDELPRWVREGLRPLPEVHASRRLVPRALP